VRPGSPGFIGERLREAREANGLTGAALAELLEIPRQSISAYEHGKATPGPETAEKIAAKLNMPMRFLFEAAEPEEVTAIFWRSRAAATKTARERSQARYAWLRRIVRYLAEYVDFPALRIPSPPNISDIAELTSEHVHDAARNARQFFGMGNGAIENMTWLLEQHGMIIAYADLGAETLDSFSQICRDGRAYVIVNGEHGSSVRYRFDLAHELGHLLLHRNLSAGYFLNATRNKQAEDQAHQFAREFLMPPALFARNFHTSTVEGLKVQKRMWGVSMQAALMHARDLNLIAKEQEQRLWRGISMRGWRRQEPLDDVIPREQPQLLRSAFGSILSAGISRDDVLDALPFSARTIEALCGLEAGTLAPLETHPSVYTLSAVPPNPVEPARAVRRDRLPVDGADVIAFSRDRSRS
jgi:Zn-dependent peptidase ImmA (M78 family)